MKSTYFKIDYLGGMMDACRFCTHKEGATVAIEIKSVKKVTQIEFESQ